MLINNSSFDSVIQEITEPSSAPSRHLQSAMSHRPAVHCPDCGTGLIRLGSCFSCPTCGFGSCG
ncbi:MAG: hypothetical protein NT002_14065 [candidate division Zixibacteria bacterium]|nr:hypothetical protein [candidate division Zixibacteria bacterium]